MSAPVLQLDHLSVRYANGTQALTNVSLSIEPGECLALVGESGSGKSTIIRAVLGLLPADTHLDGSILLDGTETVGANERTLRALRGRRAGYVPQDPAASFDATHSVAHHVKEAWRAHRERTSDADVARLLADLGIDHASRRLKQRPHQWSGGMLQRASIAAAAAHTPPLIVADEPTSALDADRADQILSAIRARGRAVLLASHDLALTANHADTVAVIYAGRIVEHGTTEQVLRRPRHPYTQALLAAIPRPGHGLPHPLPGTPPDLRDPITGCPFAPRCPIATAICHGDAPRLLEGVACWRRQ